MKNRSIFSNPPSSEAQSGGSPTHAASPHSHFIPTARQAIAIPLRQKYNADSGNKSSTPVDVNAMTRKLSQEAASDEQRATRRRTRGGFPSGIEICAGQ